MSAPFQKLFYYNIIGKITLLKRAGECGGKDQVRRADSLIFVDDELKHRMIYGRNAVGCPAFLFVCVNAGLSKVCTAQNYAKLMIFSEKERSRFQHF